MSTAASKAFHTLSPPRPSGQRKVQSVNTAAAQDEDALWTGLSSDAPDGKVMVDFEALTETVYVFFKTGTSSLTITTSNGIVIPAGSHRTFWLDASVDTYVEHIAAGNGKLKWFVASTEFDGT